MQFFNKFSLAAAFYLATSTALCLPKPPIKMNDNTIAIWELLEGKVNAPYCKLERKSTTMPSPVGGYCKFSLSLDNHI